MRLRNIIIVIIFTFIFASCKQGYEDINSLNSPNKELRLEYGVDDLGSPFYLLVDGIDTLVRESKLGFQLKDSTDLFSGFKIDKVENEYVDNIWTRVWGETKEVRNNYNQAKIFLQKTDGTSLRMNIVFRIFNDGAAFRYEIPKQEGLDKYVVVDEKTEFSLNKIDKVWWIWADYDTYEKLYNETTYEEASWVATPVTMKSKSGKYISLHEANLTDFAGMTLKQNESGIYKSELVPWSNGDKVRVEGQMLSPWRTIQVGKTPGELIESNLIVNLNEPNKIADTEWIKPMTYIGIWWGMHIGTETWTEGDRHSANTKNAFRYIDFAKNNNVGGVVIEGWNKGWDKWGQKDAFDHITPASDFDFEKVAKYAKENGVSLIGHNETGGDIPSYENLMERAFSLYESYGMNAVKTGYAGGIMPRGEYHHGQFMVRHYRKVVELAAKHKLMIDAHEPIKPTGIRRTWPNMMTREGVRGMEWNGWSDGNPPNHTLILPFTRMLAGPIDYTPGIFDVEIKDAIGERVKWNDLDKGNSRVHTTLSKQLALMVILYSPLQMASDVIDNYEDEKAFEFISHLKTTFDDSKVLNGEIGEYITIVRKSGDDWFLGSATNENARNLKIKLDFLDAGKNYTAKIFRDADGTNWLKNPSKYIVESKDVTSEDIMTLKLPEGGGYAVEFMQKD